MKRKLVEEHEEENLKKHVKLLSTELAQMKSLRREVDELKHQNQFSQLHSSSEARDTLEFTVRMPDFVTKSAEKGRGQFLQSLSFLFQDRRFRLMVYPKGDTIAGHRKASVFLSWSEHYDGAYFFRVELVNGNALMETTGNFSDRRLPSVLSWGWPNFCSSEVLLAAARATEGEALELRVHLSSAKSNRHAHILSGYS